MATTFKEDMGSNQPNSSTSAPSQTFTLFPNLPPELRLMVWEAAAAEAQQPRVLLSHCLKPAAEETHDMVKALAATCWESNVATAQHRRECQAQHDKSRSRCCFWHVHFHSETDICLTRTSWFPMCVKRPACPPIFQGFQRFMVPAKRWLEVFNYYQPARLVQLAVQFRARLGDDIREIILLLPQLPKQELWDLHGKCSCCEHLPEEGGSWVGLNAVPRDIFRFWTLQEMGQFEAAYAARVRRFPPGLGEELYSGRYEEDYVSFAAAVERGDSAGINDLVKAVDIGGHPEEGEGAGTRNSTEDVKAADMTGDSMKKSASGHGMGENPLDSLSDKHFLFELRHSWRFVFGDRLRLPFAHIRGHDVWDFLDRKVTE